jgi:hypothetical protein
MHMRLLTAAAATFCAGIAASSPAHVIDFYGFNAECSNSNYKEGPYSVDITNENGTPITCDGVLISSLDNGHIMVDFSNKKKKAPVITFGSNGVIETLNAKTMKLPLQRIYIPVLGGQSTSIDLVDGACFFPNTTIDADKMRNISCFAVIANTNQRTVFVINARRTGKVEVFSDNASRN